MNDEKEPSHIVKISDNSNNDENNRIWVKQVSVFCEVGMHRDR